MWVLQIHSRLSLYWYWDVLIVVLLSSASLSIVTLIFWHFYRTLFSFTSAYSSKKNQQFCILVSFNDSNLVYCSLKYVPSLLFFQKLLETPNIFINFHQLRSYSWLYWFILLQLVSSKISKRSHWLLPSTSCYSCFIFATNTSPKLYIHVLWIHHINLQFYSNNVFYFHLLITLLILKSGNWHDFVRTNLAKIRLC